jgi:hypothetical protein
MPPLTNFVWTVDPDHIIENDNKSKTASDPAH